MYKLYVIYFRTGEYNKESDFFFDTTKKVTLRNGGRPGLEKFIYSTWISRDRAQLISKAKFTRTVQYVRQA